MATFRIPQSPCVGDQSCQPMHDASGSWLRPPLGMLWVASPYDLSSAFARQVQAAAEPDIEFLFNSCRNPTHGLSEGDFATAATTLGVEVAAIKAVAEVETSGDPFDDAGRPRILYERHYFHRLTSGKYSEKHPDISNATAGGYGKFSAQYGKLERAYKLDVDAALKSASWGKFQIMGNNFSKAGYSSVKLMVQAMSKSEADHLKAFANLVGSDKGMLKALQGKDWAAFAKGYNGAGYKKNDYDTKMANAYKTFKAATTAAKKP